MVLLSASVCLTFRSSAGIIMAVCCILDVSSLVVSYLLTTRDNTEHKLTTPPRSSLHIVNCLRMPAWCAAVRSSL